MKKLIAPLAAAALVSLSAPVNADQTGPPPEPPLVVVKMDLVYQVPIYSCPDTSDCMVDRGIYGL